MIVAAEKKTSSADLIVVSDLHLAEGLRPDEPRYSPTEDFFFDEAFARFLDHWRSQHSDNPEALTLVLNGDTLDFLTVTKVPSAFEAESRGLDVSQAERQFGLNPTADKSIFKLDVIVQGHRVFFDSLARFVAAGHKVEIIRGNHDLELFFPEVKERLLEHLASFPSGPDMKKARALVTFHDWFYLEPGRVYIEHGNQYDESNSIRYPLRPLLSGKRWWLKEEGEALDYPLGSIFVRFFYNRVRRLDPYTPRLLSFEQYMDFIRRYNLFDIWRVYKDHYPYFVAALGPATTPGSSRHNQEGDARQEADFLRMEKDHPHGHLYRKLNSLKNIPVSASKPAMVKEMLRPLLRRALWLGIFAFVALFLWLFIFQLIDKVPWLTANAFLMSFFMVLTMGAGFGAWVHLQRKLRRSGEREAERIVRQADKIAQLTDVPLVLMGHSHSVDYRHIKAGTSVYLNSGTWTSVANPWTRLVKDARRLTFIHVRGQKASLKRWNDDACRVDDVPLFDVSEDSVIHVDSPDPNWGRTEHSWVPSAAISEEEEHPSE